MLNAKNHITSKEQNAISFSEGDESALAYFFSELFPALTYYSFKLTNNSCIAEDIASEAFIKTWRFHYKLNSFVRIKAYLYKIVHRDSVAFILKERKRTDRYKDLPQQVDIDTPFDNLVRSEVYRLIHTALKDLPPGSRKVLIMHYLEGKKISEISKELNLHFNTIATQKKQGLNALKKVFSKPMLGLLYFCIKIFIGS